MSIKKIPAFTFIELLVALSIFSIIASGLYFSLHLGIKIWSSGDEIIKENQSVRTFFNAISRDLMNAVFFSGAGFKWEESKITFPVLAEQYSEAGSEKEIFKVSYFIDGDKGLVRTLSSAKKGFSETSEEKEYILPRVVAISFEYAYGGEEDSEITWQAMWETGETVEAESSEEVPVEAETEAEEPSYPRGIKMKLSFGAEKTFSGGSGVVAGIETTSVDEIEKILFVPIGVLGDMEEE